MMFKMNINGRRGRAVTGMGERAMLLGSIARFSRYVKLIYLGSGESTLEAFDSHGGDPLRGEERQVLHFFQGAPAL